MKKGPLSKAEKYYIENNTESELSGLAKDLDRSESTISKFQPANLFASCTNGCISL